MPILDDTVSKETRQESPSERRLSPSEKGKGRASDFEPSCDPNGFLEPDEEGGRGKRVRKKRRLSSAGEIDPNVLNDDGSVNKKARVKSNVHVKEIPLTAEDRAYFARVAQNELRGPLSIYRTACPLWARTRRALQSAAECFRQPDKTIGASVGIGMGGVARGIIFEGDAPGKGVFWGEGERAGTIVTSM